MTYLDITLRMLKLAANRGLTQREYAEKLGLLQCHVSMACKRHGFEWPDRRRTTMRYGPDRRTLTKSQREMEAILDDVFARVLNANFSPAHQEA